MLRIGRAWSLRPWVLELLRRALKLLVLLRLVLILLLLAISSCRGSWTERGSQRCGKAGASVAPGRSWSGGLPLQLPHLSARGLQDDGFV
jgi:hypothetical protein